MGLERDANGHQPDSTTYSPQAHGAGAEPEEGYADLSTASAWSILDTALKGTPLSLLLQDENLVYMWAVNMPVQWGGIQFQGKNDKELPYSDDTYQDLRKIKESILKTGIPILHEEWMTAPDGTQLYLRLSMERYIFTNGRRGLLTSMLNLTEQMLVEDKLREFGDKLGVDNIQFELENVRLLSENRRYGIDNAALDQENKAGAVAMRRMGVDNTQYEQENQRLTSENTKFGIDNASLNQENKVGAVALRRLTYEKDAKQQELNEARDLQLAMLPRSFPQPDSFDIAAYMATSVEVGGDYYDFKELGNGGFVAALGDATGHGTRAGIIVSSVKSYFQILAGQEHPAKVLEAVSAGIRRMQLHHAYMGLALLEFRQNEICYASAGMPPLLVYRSQTQTVEEVAIRSLFLGTHYKKPYVEQTLPLNSGDYLVMLSDGFTETRNASGQMIGMDELIDCILKCAPTSSQAIIDALVECQDNFGHQEFLHDDCTALVIGKR